MLKKFLFISLALLCLVVNIDSADAAKKKKKKGNRPSPSLLVSPDEIYVVRQKVGKKKVKITCYDGSPGTVRNGAQGMLFSSFSKQLSQAKRRGKKSKAQKLQGLLKAGKKACRNPNFLDLDKYNGDFGVEEAHLLYNRFSFGGSPEEINLAVKEGLVKTVDRIMTNFATPTLDAQQNDLTCDGYLEGDERQEACDPRNPNDLRADGVRFDIYNRILSGPRFYMKLWFFLHDERMAVSSSAAAGCAMDSITTHVNMLKRAAYYGDYRQFMVDWNNDLLGHLFWLDGATNKGTAPNENYAREFWELGTIGPTALDGSPVYNDYDIVQSALAFSGRTLAYDDDLVDSEGDEIWRCGGTPPIPLLHAQGPKVIFAGTRHEAVVDNDMDVLNATFRHPRTAEHLAEDIWKEFINPYATSTSIKDLAQIIRSNNYNLLPVFRKIMLSQALFDPHSRGSLIKHPMEMVFGALRHSGVPILNSHDQNSGLVEYSNFEKIDDMSEQLGQRPMLPGSVFGWDTDRLAAEPYVRSWRNALVNYILNQGDQSLASRAGFGYYTRYIQSFPERPAATLPVEVVDRAARALGLSLSEQDRTVLTNYLMYDWDRCSTSTSSTGDIARYGCTGGQYFLRPIGFNTQVEASSDGRITKKIRGLLAILFGLPKYRMK